MNENQGVDVVKSGFASVYYSQVGRLVMKTTSELEEEELNADIINKAEVYIKWKKNQKKKSYHSKSGLKR